MDGSKGRGGAYINQSQQALGSSIWRNQEATWCARGQINATEETVTRDRCFLNVTHCLHIRTNTNTHLQTILGLVAHLLPQLCQRLSQTSSPRKHTFIRTYPQTRGGEDMHTEEDGGQGTHADKPDNRQETLESSCYFFSFSLLSVSILDKAGGGNNRHEKNTSSLKKSHKPWTMC